MNDRIRFDDRRSLAWREAIVTAARDDRAGRGSRHRRTVLIVALVIAALGLSGGGVAYALSARLLAPTPAVTTPTPTASAAPVQRETPGATSSPVPVPPPAETALDDAQRACRTLLSALDASGNATDRDAWTEAVADARADAASAAELDPSRAALASALDVLAGTPLPDDAATDAEKNAYGSAYLPVVNACGDAGVLLLNGE